MFQRNLFVVYKPIKNNSVLLPDSYFRTVQSYENGCLSLSYNSDVHHVFWAPYASNISDTEIGINSSVAKAIGLKEGSLVKCSLVQDCVTLDSVNVHAMSQKDWEMLEVSSYRIQSTLLDQTRIVNNGQKLVIWINRAMSLVVKIDRLKPDAPFGRLANNTEVRVAPFNNHQNNHDLYNNIKPKSMLGNGVNGLDRSKSQIIRPTSQIIAPSLQKNLEQQLSVREKRSSMLFDEKPTAAQQKQPNGIYKPQNIVEKLSKQQTDRKDNKLLGLESLMANVKSLNTKQFQFRVIESKWEDSQMCDLYLTKHNCPEFLDINQVFGLKTMAGKEYYVNIKIINDAECFPHNIYPTIEMNDILMRRLEIRPMERIVLTQKHTVVNFVERIELWPNKSITYKQVREIEDQFKQYILDNTSLYPVLLNQNQIFKIKDGSDELMVSVVLYPESFNYCLCDADILQECKINCVEQVKDLSAETTVAASKSNENGGNVIGAVDAVKNTLIKLDKFTRIIDDCVERMKINLCLDERNSFHKMGNVIICGNQNTGKTTICKGIVKQLAEKPFYCHSETFSCSRNKGRKPESIQKDLRQILATCLQYEPSILILDNLDALTQSVAEQTQDGDYYNRVSDVIQHLILEYTKDHSIAVIATVTSKSNLNKRVHTSRGRHLFQTIFQIPDLEQPDRERIVSELCQKVKTNKINYLKFSNLTEGYTFGDLGQLVERAVFYAYRIDSNAPILTNDILTESLKVTNSYCLQGIENNNKVDASDDDGATEKVCGLESVVTVLEEVLIWPTKYPTIFNQSPLRNQAGVLLYGPPGTGKTYLVSKLAKQWHLRMICVKGPELLAKYIGQSEENVRNLFDRARSAKPCVLFFDEFDSLAPRRGHDSTGVTDRVVNQLLTELDGVEGLQGVIVIAATSRPELLDGALLRSGRIDRLVECPLPDQAARLEIFKTLSNSLNFTDDVDLEYFANNSDKYTGADIQSILTSANMNAVKDCLALDSENVPDTITIRQEHLMDAFIGTRPSLSPLDIEKYRIMYDRFTNKEKPSRDFVAKRATLA